MKNVNELTNRELLENQTIYLEKTASRTNTIGVLIMLYFIGKILFTLIFGL